VIGRAALLSVMILSAGLYGARVGSHETTVSRTALTGLPRTLDEWSGRMDVPLGADVIGVLGVDDYLNRSYVNASGQPVHLYIGYYGSQRQGDTIHSPLNCLPGAGWQIMHGGRTALDVGASRLTVNRYVIQKGLDRQVALYWYQGRGRVIANEYANKFWLLIDSAWLHRSNGSLVRVLAPVAGGASASVDAADRAAADFTRALYPRLAAYLP
jgi:EpsI family protein